MNTMNINSENTTAPESTERPLGFWLKAADRFRAQALAEAFKAEGMSRRDWRLLHYIDGSRKLGRPLPEHKLEGLVARNLITKDAEEWVLTDEGRATKERMGLVVERFRARVTEAVPAEDLETTKRTLEMLARELGWDESTPLPRGRRRGFDRGHGHGNGFGHGPDFSGHGGHRGHAGFGGDRFAARIARVTQQTYERGFDAGFSRGREI